MLAADIQPFLLLGAALLVFLFSTRQLPIAMRVFAWLVGVSLTVAAWLGGPLLPTDFSDLSGFAKDAAPNPTRSVLALALTRNLAGIGQSLNPLFEIFFIAVAVFAAYALFAFRPRDEMGVPPSRRLSIAMFSAIIGAFAAVTAAVAFGFAPKRSMFFARGEDVDIVAGDTLRMGDVALRLAGIAAPEFHPREGARHDAGNSDPRNQVCFNPAGEEAACGEAASQALRELVSGGIVLCARLPQADSFGRVLAQCRVRKPGAREFDLAQRMAASGFVAASEERAGSIDYGGAIINAQHAARNLWAACTLTPEAWRVRRMREAFREKRFQEIAAADFINQARCPPAAALPEPPAPPPEQTRRRTRQAS